MKIKPTEGMKSSEFMGKCLVQGLIILNAIHNLKG